MEEIKAQMRQNTLLLQALLKKQQPADVAVKLHDELKFPISDYSGLRKVEDLLKDPAQQNALVETFP